MSGRAVFAAQGDTGMPWEDRGAAGHALQSTGRPPNPRTVGPQMPACCSCVTGPHPASDGVSWSWMGPRWSEGRKAGPLEAPRLQHGRLGVWGCLSGTRVLGPGLHQEKWGHDRELPVLLVHFRES